MKNKKIDLTGLEFCPMCGHKLTKTKTKTLRASEAAELRGRFSAPLTDLVGDLIQILCMIYTFYEEIYYAKIENHAIVKNMTTSKPSIIH